MRLPFYITPTRIFSTGNGTNSTNSTNSTDDGEDDDDYDVIGGSSDGGGISDDLL
jgi:hypothetical protein